MSYEKQYRSKTSGQPIAIPSPPSPYSASPAPGVEHETVRAVIDAYADGKIELPAIDKKTRSSAICAAPSVVADDIRDDVHHPYTRLSIATFLGWTRKQGDRLKPNCACAQAFAALELIERKLLKESDFRGQF